ncbi:MULTISPECIES: FtsB family cell division protein [Lentzea]|nr:MULTISPECIES: septum formation initiator family protein [Lentzea]MCG8924063.1 septum formation initiator family protein [Lentzea sp. CC55]WVH78230.1 septum formation initiator family protein [Lentzea sp. DG1S-22]
MAERARRPRRPREEREARPARARKPPRPKAPARRGDGTGGAFGMTGTRRAAMFAMVLCALALSIAVPLRTYLSQRDELRDVGAEQQKLRETVAALEKRKAELQDPAYVEIEARKRLHWVRPGETPYIVQLPGDESRNTESERPSGKPAAQGSWYEELWESVTHK